ncbi:MAG TPA: hypothetical protein VHN79_01600 [Lacunisphaera sp.]|nr:hypothetical protein [Lacunisphaera sp.]
MKPLLLITLLLAVILGLAVYRDDDPQSLPLALPAPQALARETATTSSAGLPLATAPTAAPAVVPARVPSAADDIARLLRTGAATDRDQAFHVLLPRLVAEDPALAGHLALAWDAGALREEFLGHVVRLWTSADINGVVTWTASLLDDSDRTAAARAATAQVAQTDPAGAIELARLLGPAVEDGRMERLAQLWTEENPRAAQAWIENRPADAWSDRLLARIAHVRAQQEPAAAAGLVLNRMAAGAARDDALVNVARQWALRDPDAAAAWVDQFPAGPLRHRALASLEIAARLR